MNEPSTFSILTYTFNNLTRVIAEWAKTSPNAVGEDRQLRHFDDTLKKLLERMCAEEEGLSEQTITMLVENEYVDRDRLHDYQKHEVFTFGSYTRYCRRIFLFHGRLPRSALVRMLRGLEQQKGAMQAAKDILSRELGKRLMAVLVVRDRQALHMCRMVIRYPWANPTVDSAHVVPFLRDYEHGLFGLNLILSESLAATQQDSIVSVCAASALWVLFHALQLDRNNPAFPSPGSITQTGAEGPLTSLNQGMSIGAMARAVRAMGLHSHIASLNFDAAQGQSQELSFINLRRLTHAYVSQGITAPILSQGCYQPYAPTTQMVASAKDEQKQWIDDPKPIFIHKDSHAITIVGYHMGSRKNIQPPGPEIIGNMDGEPNNKIASVADCIDKLVVHDDTRGGFVKCGLKGLQREKDGGYGPVDAEKTDKNDVVTFGVCLPNNPFGNRLDHSGELRYFLAHDDVITEASVDIKAATAEEAKSAIKAANEAKQEAQVAAEKAVRASLEQDEANTRALEAAEALEDLKNADKKSELEAKASQRAHTAQEAAERAATEALVAETKAAEAVAKAATAEAMATRAKGMTWLRLPQDLLLGLHHKVRVDYDQAEESAGEFENALHSFANQLVQRHPNLRAELLESLWPGQNDAGKGGQPFANMRYLWDIRLYKVSDLKGEMRNEWQQHPPVHERAADILTENWPLFLWRLRALRMDEPSQPMFDVICDATDARDENMVLHVIPYWGRQKDQADMDAFLLPYGFLERSSPQTKRSNIFLAWARQAVTKKKLELHMLLTEQALACKRLQTLNKIKPAKRNDAQKDELSTLRARDKEIKKELVEIEKLDLMSDAKGERLDTLFGAGALPHNIKPYEELHRHMPPITLEEEWVRQGNPLEEVPYCRTPYYHHQDPTTANKKKMKKLLDKHCPLDPERSKIYIWAIDANGRLVVGKELPLLDEKGNPRMDGKDSEKLGHPSLVSAGEARIAGEIRYDKDDGTDNKDATLRWRINNRSGRYTKWTKPRTLEHFTNAARAIADAYDDESLFQTRVHVPDYGADPIASPDYFNYLLPDVAKRLRKNKAEPGDRFHVEEARSIGLNLFSSEETPPDLSQCLEVLETYCKDKEESDPYKASVQFVLVYGLHLWQKYNRSWGVQPQAGNADTIESKIRWMLDAEATPADRWDLKGACLLLLDDLLIPCDEDDPYRPHIDMPGFNSNGKKLFTDQFNAYTEQHKQRSGKDARIVAAVRQLKRR
ncbi:MAG: hypothetical protein HQL53_03505 [Magnetococcales bacterium]|nr:hypothetical protein [Magnetococcales bacterium]